MSVSGQVVPKRRRPWGKIATVLIGLIIIIAVFAFLFPQMGDYSQALQQVRAMGPWWILALIVASLANIVLYAFTAIAAIPHLPYRAAFVSRQAAFLISNIIPGGGAIGVGAQYSVLATYRVPYGLAAAAVAADGIGVYLITLGAPAIAIVGMSLSGHPLGGYSIPAWIGLAVVIVSAVVITITLRSDTGATRAGRWLQPPVNLVFRPFKKATPPDITQILTDLHDEASVMVGERWRSLLATTLIAQFMPMVVLMVGLAGMGAVPVPLSLLEVFAAFAIAMMLTMIPITPGGLGTADAALVAVLVSMGLDSSTALAADLVWRLVWFFPQILAGIGSFAYLAWEKRHGRIETAYTEATTNAN